MRVPAEPHPPAGAPGSLRVFRAGKNFFKLKLAVWGAGQVVALAGIVFWIWIFAGLEGAALDLKANRARAEQRVPAPTHSAASAPAAPLQGTATNIAPVAPTPTEPTKPVRKASASGRKQRGPRELFDAWKMQVAVTLAQLPGWAFVLVWVLKLFGVLAYLAQLPVTYAIARFDYEMRWYLVTDRSLRIRHGIWKLEESTMSFINIQQVVVSQGPLQRLLGLGDVRVQSAGGGNIDPHGKHDVDTLHAAIFHAVDNANEIRDLILARLRQFRASGLGDPDDATDHAVAAPADRGDALAAAQELLTEVRALRGVLTR